MSAPDDEFDFETESHRLNAIKLRGKEERQRLSDQEVCKLCDEILARPKVDDDDQDKETAAIAGDLYRRAEQAKASLDFIRGEPAYDDRSGSWKIKVANLADFPDFDEKFGFSESGHYEGKDLVSFLRRFCMSTLPVASTVVIQKIDEISRSNPYFSELLRTYRLHASASLRMQRPMRYPHVLLVGPPGVGKTHVARDLADAMGMPFSVIDAPSLSGGASSITGRDKAWKNPGPGKIAETLMRHESAGQMILIDEIDKAYNHYGHDDPLTPLHALLEPSTSRTWRDECLGAVMDASWISIIATANSIDEIAPSLLDRFTIIEIAKPDCDQLRKVIVSIAKSLAADHGDYFSQPAIHADVIDILSAGENTPRSIRQTLSMAFVHAASHGRRQVIPADLSAVAAMSCKMDRPRMGFMR